MQKKINRGKQIKTLNSILVLVFLLGSFNSLAQATIQCDYEKKSASDFLTLSFHLDAAQSFNIKFDSINDKEFSLLSADSFPKGEIENTSCLEHLQKTEYDILSYNESIQLTQKF